MWEMTMIVAAERSADRHSMLLRDPVEARQARFPVPDNPAHVATPAGQLDQRLGYRPLRQRARTAPRSRRLLHRR